MNVSIEAFLLNVLNFLIIFIEAHLVFIKAVQSHIRHITLRLVQLLVFEEPKCTLFIKLILKVATVVFSLNFRHVL